MSISWIAQHTCTKIAHAQTQVSTFDIKQTRFYKKYTEIFRKYQVSMSLFLFSKQWRRQR